MVRTRFRDMGRMATAVSSGAEEFGSDGGPQGSGLAERSNTITLVYRASDEGHNQSVVLRERLDQHIARRSTSVSESSSCPRRFAASRRRLLVSAASAPSPSASFALRQDGPAEVGQTNPTCSDGTRRITPVR